MTKPCERPRDENGRLLPYGPTGRFYCSFCGKLVVRRLSKVKNPDLVFCNNACRGHYTEREHLKAAMLSEQEFLAEYQRPEIHRCASFVVARTRQKYPSARRYSYEEFWQEMLIALWKFGKRAHDTTKGDKWNFYITIFKTAMLQFLRMNAWSVEELSLEDCRPICVSSGPLDVREHLLLKEIQHKAATKKNWKWFSDYYIDNKKSSEIAAEYGEDMRTVTCAISYIKKTLVARYSQEA